MTEAYGFIFDLDGTIVDSTAHYRETWAELLNEFGAEGDPEAYLGRSTRENFRALFGEDLAEKELEEHVARQAQIGASKMRSRGVRAHDGVLELVRGLGARGVKLGLATAAEKSNAEWTLKALGIRELFDAVVVDRDVASGKPAPDIYREAMRRLGVTAKQCAVMEDSITGLRAAKTAGLRVIAVVTTRSRRELDEAGADLVVERATELDADEVIRFILNTARDGTRT